MPGSVWNFASKNKKGRRSRQRASLLSIGCALFVASCVGYATYPAGVNKNSAILRARAWCAAETTHNPCTWWFQYWQNGSSTIFETPRLTQNVPINNVPLDREVTGLQEGTLYHYQFCGYGDTSIAPPGLCTGPLTGTVIGGVNNPGTFPNLGDFNTVASFRTAGETTKGTFDVGRVLSAADTADRPISRDGGVSVQYSTNPPRALWIFADTDQRPGSATIFLGTAAHGGFTPGMAPTVLEELPTPPSPPQSGGTAPAPFFPRPTGLLTKDGRECPIPAAWVSGAAKLPDSSHVLITYSEVCIESQFVFYSERVALAVYDPFANRFVYIDRPIEASPLNAGLPARMVLHSPVFADGYLYLYAADRDTKGVYVARVRGERAYWSNAANLWWWSGQGWTKNNAAAVTIVPDADPLTNAVHVADYSAVSSRKFVMLEQRGFGNAAFQTYYATSPRGPWTRGLAAQPPDPCQGGTWGCRTLFGHPELSTSMYFVYSWFSVDDRNGHGHVRLAAVAW